MDRDHKSGGSVITERFYIDNKQDFLKKTPNWPEASFFNSCKTVCAIAIFPAEKYPVWRYVVWEDRMSLSIHS